ncbi:hypothetical protein HMPREF9442_03287 [Paraprevotella xylaniphila YIT 11841]|uniref:Uncharacterized protein n=1 Tax=Paraprevotella xylaniphila YIT 11841 TaxID=762982 RepID=F3QYJ3_9BACT|nr:hypothetical protein HMPREF9442_03287 [Paraprevotella xylaniphila YIT 11841]
MHSSIFIRRKTLKSLAECTVIRNFAADLVQRGSKKRGHNGIRLMEKPV